MSKTRIKYKFTLNFPSTPFSVHDLTTRGNHPKYITAYVRVKNALKANKLVPAGVRPSTKRGAKEKLYVATNAKVATVSASKVTV